MGDAGRFVCLDLQVDVASAKRPVSALRYQVNDSPMLDVCKNAEQSDDGSEMKAKVVFDVMKNKKNVFLPILSLAVGS